MEKLQSIKFPQYLQDMLDHHNSGITYIGTRNLLTYQMHMPYDIHIMASDSQNNRVFSHHALLSSSISGWIDGNFLPSTPYMPNLSPAMYSDTPFSSVMHRHEYFELMYVLSGTVEQIIETERHIFEEGSLCLLNCEMEHAEIFSTDFACIYLCINPDYLTDQLLEELPINTPLSRFFRNNTREDSDFKKDYLNFRPVKKQPIGPVEQILNLIAEEHILMRPGYRYLINGLILRLLDTLQLSDLYHCDYIQLNPSSESYIFTKATRIMEHSAAPLSREELSDALNYNSDYINRIIKKYSGQSIVHYNRSIQIKKAERLLTESEKSISEIIHILGYENRTHFYRAFQKKHGITPAQYRDQNRRKPSST